MKFALASTSCLCFTLSFKNGLDLASVPLIVSCVNTFTRHCPVAGVHGVPECDTAEGGASY